MSRKIHPPSACDALFHPEQPDRAASGTRAEINQAAGSSQKARPKQTARPKQKDCVMLGMKFIVPAFIAFTLIPAAFESASAASDPTGIWMDDTGRGAVEIKQCGGNLCGNVVWVKSASDASGCGKPVIGDVKPVGGGRWDNGWIYSPEKKRKYDVELTPLANGNLKVLGYAGMKFLSKTMIWKPAPADLPLCGKTEAKADVKPAAPASKKSDVETGSITPPPAPAAPKATPAAAAKDAKASTQAPAAKNAKANDKAQEAEAPAASPDENKSADADDTAKDDSTASDDDSKGDDLAGALGKIKIGDLSLDKVLTKTKSGKCKLDLPWFKVTIDCEQ
jgi:uncharacterized protein (DUF2147 family)